MISHNTFSIVNTSYPIAANIYTYTIFTFLCVLAVRVGTTAAFIIDTGLSRSAMGVLST